MIKIVKKWVNEEKLRIKKDSHLIMYKNILSLRFL